MAKVRATAILLRLKKVIDNRCNRRRRFQIRGTSLVSGETVFIENGQTDSTERIDTWSLRNADCIHRRTWPPATFSTGNDLSRRRDTIRWTKARRAGRQHLSWALTFPRFSFPQPRVSRSFRAVNMGTYRKWEIATAFCSTVDARYFFSTDNFAAAAGLASTTCGFQQRARGGCGRLDSSAKISIHEKAQQYSSL